MNLEGGISWPDYGYRDVDIGESLGGQQPIGTFYWGFYHTPPLLDRLTFYGDRCSVERFVELAACAGNCVPESVRWEQASGVESSSGLPAPAIRWIIGLVVVAVRRRKGTILYAFQRDPLDLPQGEEAFHTVFPLNPFAASVELIDMVLNEAASEQVEGASNTGSATSPPADKGEDATEARCEAKDDGQGDVDGKHGDRETRQTDKWEPEDLTSQPTVDWEKFSICWKDNHYDIGNIKEFYLFERLCRKPGVYVSRADLVDEVWEGDLTEKAAVQNAVSSLRKHLKKAGMEELVIDGQKNRGYYALILPKNPTSGIS